MSRPAIAVLFLCLVATSGSTAMSETSKELVNHGLRIELDAVTGAIRSLTNRLTNDKYDIRTPAWRIETGTRLITPDAAKNFGFDDRQAWFTYDAGGIEVKLTYSTVAETDFVEATLVI